MAKNEIATNHKELIVWQLCHQLRSLTLKFTRNNKDDLRWRSQIRASIRSACNNASEGFYRKRDGDFLNHLIFALASLGEFEDQLDEGLSAGAFTQVQHGEMKWLVIRAWRANSALRRYLAESIAKEKARKKAAREKEKELRRLQREAASDLKDLADPVGPCGPCRTRPPLLYLIGSPTGGGPDSGMTPFNVAVCA